MSSFSAVDAAERVQGLTRYLDATAKAASGMKHYAAATHALRNPDGPILDLGCGAGHDLTILGSAGMRVVGVDPSAMLLAAASQRAAHEGAPLVRAVGEALPFADGTFAGCRIERVLMHVVDPTVVLQEAVRVLAQGSLITVYEPDWSSFRVRTERGDRSAGWISGVRHPAIGGELCRLLGEAGCEVADRVEELSIWRSLRVLDAVVNLTESVRRAVDGKRITASEADRWLTEQRDRESRAEYFSTISKVLVVARKL